MNSVESGAGVGALTPPVSPCAGSGQAPVWPRILRVSPTAREMRRTRSSRTGCRGGNLRAKLKWPRDQGGFACALWFAPSGVGRVPPRAQPYRYSFPEARDHFEQPLLGHGPHRGAPLPFTPCAPGFWTNSKYEPRVQGGLRPAWELGVGMLEVKHVLT